MCSIDLFFQTSFQQYVKSSFGQLMRSTFVSFPIAGTLFSPIRTSTRINFSERLLLLYHQSLTLPKSFQSKISISYHKAATKSTAPGRHEPGLPQAGPPKRRRPRAAGLGSLEDLGRRRGLLGVLRRLHLAGSEEKCDRRYDEWMVPSGNST